MMEVIQILHLNFVGVGSVA